MAQSRSSPLKRAQTLCKRNSFAHFKTLVWGAGAYWATAQGWKLVGAIFLLSLCLAKCYRCLLFPSFFPCFCRVPSLHSFFASLQPVSTIIMLFWAMLQSTNVSWRGTSTDVWYPSIYILSPNFCGCHLSTSLDHLSLKVREACAPTSHGTVIIRDTFWQTAAPRALRN